MMFFKKGEPIKFKGKIQEDVTIRNLMNLSQPLVYHGCTDRRIQYLLHKNERKSVLHYNGPDDLVYNKVLQVANDNDRVILLWCKQKGNFKFYQIINDI